MSKKVQRYIDNLETIIMNLSNYFAEAKIDYELYHVV